MPDRRSRLGSRLALAAASLVLIAGLLEGAARVATAGLVRRVRPGLYASVLPLVSSGVPRATEDPGGPPLPAEKDPGEVRVVVLGESSVEGLPWGPRASPAAMLHDLLAPRLADRRLTVLNLGRAAAQSADLFYYAAYAASFDPDVVICFAGVNDVYRASTELCAPLEHPRLHAAWRWLAARSRLLWATRVFAARASAAGPGEGERDDGPLCDAREGFAAWADLLIEAGGASGARVIVSSPVESWLADPDGQFAQGSAGHEPLGAVATARGPYRAALERLLAEPPDWQGAAAAMPCVDAWCARPGQGLDPERGPAVILERGLTWEQRALARGVTFVDTAAALAGLTPGGRLGPPVIVDRCHLSIEGYLALATLLASATLAVVDEQAAPIDAPRRLPDARAYHAPQDADVLTSVARGALERRHLLEAASASALALQAGSAEARGLREALRARLGAPTP